MVSYRELADFTDLDVIGCFMKLEKEDPFAVLSYLVLWQIGVEGITLYRKMAGIRKLP